VETEKLQSEIKDSRLDFRLQISDCRRAPANPSAVLSDSPGFGPNLESSQNWHRMDRQP
jgi:hypothetical protein